MANYQDKVLSECQVVLKRCDELTKKSPFVTVEKIRPKNPKSVRKPSTCKICGEVFSKSGLKTHILRHKKIKDFKCSFCPSKFTTRPELERHTAVHTQERPIRCAICETYISSLVNLYMHEKTHFTSKHFTTSHTLQQFKKSRRCLQMTFTCVTCKEKFKSFKEIINHISPYIKCLKCIDCGNGFATLEEKEKHLEDSDEELECKYCFKNLPNFCELTIHQATHSNKSFRNGDTIQCTQCSTEVSSIPALKCHVQNAHPDKDAVKKCEDCECSFSNELLFSLHTQIVHTHLDEGVKKCHICETQLNSKTFNSTKYAKHIIENHFEIEIGKDIKCIYCTGVYSGDEDSRNVLVGHVQRHITHSSNIVNDLRVSCNKCKQTFASIGSLRSHRYQVHKKSLGLKCAICKKGHSIHSQLVSHMQRHLQERSYKCEECGKSWVTFGDLQKHLKSHKGARNYPCQFCGKAFKIVENRRRHELTVHSENQVSCTVCSKKFSHWNYLKDHLVIHSETKNFKCKFCDKAYQSRPNMYRHMRECHKS